MSLTAKEKIRYALITWINNIKEKDSWGDRFVWINHTERIIDREIFPYIKNAKERKSLENMKIYIRKNFLVTQQEWDKLSPIQRGERPGSHLEHQTHQLVTERDWTNFKNLLNTNPSFQ